MLDIRGNISRSIEFTQRLFDDIGNFVVLLVVAAIPILNIAFLGYCARVIRDTPGADKPPKFEKLAQSWLDELLILLAAVVWFIIPAALAAAVVASSQAVVLQLRPLTAILALGFWLMALIAALFVFGVFAVLGIAHMVKTEKISKAFAVSELLDILHRIGLSSYLLWYLAMFVLAMIVSLLESLHWLISLVLSVPFATFASRSLGLLYAEAFRD